MKEIILIASMVGNFVVTSYIPDAKQTDSSPWITSIGERVNNHGIAVHPSLFCPKAKRVSSTGLITLCKRGDKCPDKDAIHYHDVLYIEDVGYRIVNDIMANKTQMNSRFDVWVPGKKDERAFHKQFGKRQLSVWRVVGNPYASSN